MFPYYFLREVLPIMCFTESELLFFFMSWFVAIEMGHHFARYRLGKFSSSLLDCTIIPKTHRSLGHESSFARQLSHERFVILAKFLLSPQNTNSITTKAEDRNSVGYKYMAIAKASGCPALLEPEILPDLFLLHWWCLGTWQPNHEWSSVWFVFFLSDLHKCDGTGSNSLLQSLSHLPFPLTLLPKRWGWWWPSTFPAATGPSSFLLYSKILGHIFP